jgi:outer membrane protein assembly factor BamA
VAAFDQTFGQHSGQTASLGPDGKPQLVIPASERFFAGGDTTVRGFALDQLGIPLVTLDEQGFPTGGGGLMILNAEVRVPTIRGLGVVGFFDTGNVFYRTSDIRLSELRGSVDSAFATSRQSDRYGSIWDSSCSATSSRTSASR